MLTALLKKGFVIQLQFIENKSKILHLNLHFNFQFEALKNQLNRKRIHQSSFIVKIAFSGFSLNFRRMESLQALLFYPTKKCLFCEKI